MPDTPTWTPAQIVAAADVIEAYLTADNPDAARALFRTEIEEIAMRVWPVIAGHERRRIQELLVGPALDATRCVPDGRIQRGCVIHDGATVRERLRQAYLAAFLRPTNRQETPDA